MFLYFLCFSSSGLDPLNPDSSHFFSELWAVLLNWQFSFFMATICHATITICTCVHCHYTTKYCFLSYLCHLKRFTLGKYVIEWRRGSAEFFYLDRFFNFNQYFNLFKVGEKCHVYNSSNIQKPCDCMHLRTAEIIFLY